MIQGRSHSELFVSDVIAYLYHVFKTACDPGLRKNKFPTSLKTYESI